MMDGVNNDIVGHDPLLAPLGDYGGPVQTFGLFPGSPAINAGTGTEPDARGIAPVEQKDIGAFESQGFSFSSTSGSGQSTQIDTPFAQALTVTVVANDAGLPVAGGVVTFSVPASGASATLMPPRSPWTPTVLPPSQRQPTTRQAVTT